MRVGESGDGAELIDGSDGGGEGGRGGGGGGGGKRDLVVVLFFFLAWCKYTGSLVYYY